MSIISLPRQHLKPHPDQAVIPVEKPRGVEPRRLPCAPGTSRHVLDELRAADAPIPPTALRQAFDRPAPTWLPAIGLRAVPLRSIDDNLAKIRAVLAAHPWTVNQARLDLGIAITKAMGAPHGTDWATQLVAVNTAAINALNTLAAEIQAEVNAR